MNRALSPTDIPRLAGAVDGVNLKLAKCGSLREAVRIVHIARSFGMSVMAGCMIESSLGISAIAQLAPMLDHADFDGAALLADDPFSGVTIAGGSIQLTDKPGPRRHTTNETSEPRCSERRQQVSPCPRSHGAGRSRTPGSALSDIHVRSRSAKASFRSVGSRVVVPFRTGKEIGICLGPANPAALPRKVRTIVDVPDDEPAL